MTPAYVHTPAAMVFVLSVIVFHRLNLGVETALPVRVIVVCLRQITQLSPLAALGNIILIRLECKLPLPTYSNGLFCGLCLR